MDGEGEGGWDQAVSMLDTAMSSRSWTGRIRSVTGCDNKKVSQRALRTELWRSRRNTGHWQPRRKTDSHCGSLELPPMPVAQGVRNGFAHIRRCARRGLEKVACAPVHRMKRSCRDKAPRWPSDEGIHWVWRKGQQGGTAKPGSNLRRRSALEA